MVQNFDKLVWHSTDEIQAEKVTIIFIICIILNMFIILDMYIICGSWFELHIVCYLHHIIFDIAYDIAYNVSF
jgi:hypothetical protein